MSQQGGPQPWMPTGQATGSPWEQNMQTQLASSGGAPDLALQQAMLRRQQQMGQGPQYQGTGSIGGGTVSAAPQIQKLSQAMGSQLNTGQTPNPAAMKAGYQASTMTDMDKIYRAAAPNLKLEQPKWMGRG